MSWEPTDCHAHTVLSDGRLTVAELEQIVRGRGVRPSVSDHLSADTQYDRGTVDSVREYLDILEPHAVLRAGEFCWHDDLWRSLPPEVVSRFSHWLGSVHAVLLPGGGVHNVFRGDLPMGVGPEAYMRLHVENVERLAREMPVDILAHPTLLPMPLRRADPDELWTEELEERLVAALAGSGIAFEVSNRYRPHERLVRRARESGVRLSLGSDGHTAEQVGDLRFPLELVRALGVPDGELYDPVTHGSRTQIPVASARQ